MTSENGRSTARETLAQYFGAHHGDHTPLCWQVAKGVGGLRTVTVECSCGKEIELITLVQVVDAIAVGWRNVMKVQATPVVDRA